MSPLLLVLAGLTGLFVGGDLLVRGAAGIATRLAVPPMIVGLTIVGFGTSVPELLVSLDAARSGAPAIAIGNVLGSNIANILLILGLAALLAPLPAPLAGVRKDLGWMLAAALALPLILWSGSIGPIEGGLMLAGLAAYLWTSLSGAAGEAPDKAPALPLSVFFFAAGLAGVILGAGFLVDGATSLARGWGVSEAMIGLTIVAVGTSLPELAATMAAALKSQRDIALGNIIGNSLGGALRNPSAADGQFGRLILGFAVTEALGIFSLLIALLLLFAV